MMIFENKKSVGKSNGDKTRKYKTKW
jgi:hypothetical protein